MKYEFIKKHKLSHEQISKALGYKTRNSFRFSSAHKRIMNGLNILLGSIEKNETQGNNPSNKT